MNCPRSVDDAPAFVAGALAPDDLESFETHLLSCAECRSVVRVGAGVRRTLRDGAGVTMRRARGSEDRGPARRVASRRLVTAGLALLAASVAWVILAGGPGRDADPLHAILAPTFDPQPVRSGEAVSATAALVDHGMEAYLRGDYARAAARLSKAARLDSTPGVSLFLGASQLLSGKAMESLPALRRAWAEPGGPFEVDARRLAAKAWLRVGIVDSALAVLEPSGRGADPSLASLAALADSIRASR